MVAKIAEHFIAVFETLNQKLKNLTYENQNNSFNRRDINIQLDKFRANKKNASADYARTGC